jgi:hypothetical protein
VLLHVEKLQHACFHSLLQVLAHGKALLGYTVLGPVALLLLAEAVRVSGVLPGGHEIKTVVQSKWHRINLQVGLCCWERVWEQHQQLQLSALVCFCCQIR